MKQKTKPTIAIVLGTILLFTGLTYAQRYMENLGRGVVAINQGSGNVYVGWRLLGTDPNDIAFNLYRSTGGGAAVKRNTSPITLSTNYVDSGVSTSQSNSYFVRPVLDGQELAPSAPFTLPASAPVQQYLSVPLQRPAGGTVPGGGTYTYNANDCSVGDLDGDGEYEIVLKWDPSNSQDNSISGYTGNVYLDAYERDGTLMWRIDLGINIRAGAHYTQFMVYDLDSDGRAEVACKTAPGTVDGQDNYVILPGDDPNADYRNADGYILAGPEYLTVFDGLTGAELATTDYIPPRHPDTLFPTPQQIKDIWGDDYGNRCDRFLACIAYLDGVRPSLVMCRGYYYGQDGGPGRTVLAAWNWRRSQPLTNVWTFDTMFGPPENDAYRGQGNHNLSVGDVDDDGKDEIVYGACCIDDDGTGLWTTGLGHGDAMHLSDINPDRPGLEKWGIHEGASTPGSALLDARTGEILWQTANADVGRGVSADLTAAYRGMECWGGTTGLRSCTNLSAGSSPSSTNHVCWWDSDLLRELLNGTSISKYGGSTLLSASGCSSNNGTKSNPCLQVDIFGDWREEVIWRTSDNTALRIYTTTTPATNRIYTLMHDPQYRLSIVWQNVAYNQPPHTGFYLGDGMAPPPHPDIRFPGPQLYGDFTGDDIVDMNDIPYFTDFWLENDCNETAELDLNYDCIINFYEFSALAENWLIAEPSITIQEDTTGFCNVDGVIESTNSGFTGTGYANTYNTTGTGVDWRINIQSSGTYIFTWRFANGSTSNMPARLLVNGFTVASTIDFPATGAWTTWSEVSVDVTLTTGIKDIRLEATGSSGLANIDYLMVTGSGSEAASCM